MSSNNSAQADLSSATEIDSRFAARSALPRFRVIEEPWQAISDPAELDRLGAMQPEELGAWLDRLSKAGVAARRHNSPDLLGQLAQSLRRPIDTILCSVLDSDAVACLNAVVAASFPIEVAAGAFLLARLTGAGRVLFIADARRPLAWSATLRRMCDGRAARLVSLVSNYPQADPTLLVYTMLSRRLRPGRLPSDAGAILLDGVAAAAVGRVAMAQAAMSQLPLVVRDWTSGLCHFVLAPVGMMVSDLLVKLGTPAQGRIIRGGDLLRDQQMPGNALIDGGENVLNIADPEPAPIPSGCIRCGWCVDACPARVQPAAVLEAAQQNDAAMAEQAGVEACVACGICSYVCPSRLPLLEVIRSLRYAS